MVKQLKVSKGLLSGTTEQSYMMREALLSVVLTSSKLSKEKYGRNYFELIITPPLKPRYQKFPKSDIKLTNDEWVLNEQSTVAKVSRILKIKYKDWPNFNIYYGNKLLTVGYSEKSLWELNIESGSNLKIMETEQMNRGAQFQKGLKNS